MFDENRRVVVIGLAFLVLLCSYLLYRAFMHLNLSFAFLPGYWWLGQVCFIISAVIVSFFSYFFVYRRKEVMQFLVEVVVETKKVVWPSLKQTKAVTLVVLVLVIISAIILAFFDYLGTLFIDGLVPFIFGR